MSKDLSHEVQKIIIRPNVMGFIEIITQKPVLIGLHLGFAIIAIDAFLWGLGEIIAGIWNKKRLTIVFAVGVISFFFSWILGGYYYVNFYGSLVKPIIKAGQAPWAHSISMESKEHIFLFVIPLAITSLFIAFLSKNEAKKIKQPTMILVGLVATLGLLIGAMGFIVSAAARWGVI